MKHILVVVYSLLGIFLALLLGGGWWLYTMYERYQSQYQQYDREVSAVNHALSAYQISEGIASTRVDRAMYDALVKAGYIGSVSRVNLVDAVSDHAKGFLMMNAQLTLRPQKPLTVNQLPSRFVVPSSVRYEGVTFEANFADDLDAMAWLHGVQALPEMKMSVLTRCQFKRDDSPFNWDQLAYPLWLQCHWSFIEVPAL